MESRPLLSGIGFLSGLGIVATGQYAAIRSDAVSSDATGNTFITGSFRGTVAFDPNSAGGTFTTAGTQDTFVVKYNSKGSLLWVTTFAGQSTTNPGGGVTSAVSEGSALAVDSSGRLFVSGSFNGKMVLKGSAGTTSVTSVPSATEPFVAMLDSDGGVSWFDAVGGTAYDTDSAVALAPDGAGGVIFGGSFAESANFGATKLTAAGASEAFVARVDGNGSFLWAVATRGVNGSNAQVKGLAVDASGNVDLAGFFSGTLDFDPSTSSSSLTSAGSVDAFVWKLGPAGNLTWCRSYGSTDYDAATALAADSAGNLYVTGTFSNTVNFGTTTRPDAITAGPTGDAFVLKVDPLGNEIWAKGLVGPVGSSQGLGICVETSSLVDVAGNFSATVDFDPGPGVDNRTSVGSSDVFLAGFDASGNLAYALQAGHANFNAAIGLTCETPGTVAITGIYSGSIGFGSSTLPSTSGTGAFMALATTLGPPTAPSTPVLDPSSDTGRSQSDGITATTSPTIDVNTALASSTIRLLRNGVVVATRTGPGPLIDPGPLADGTYSYTALQITPGGILGPMSGTGLVTILTTPPSQLSKPNLDPDDDSGMLNDGITNVAQPRLTVTAKAGTTVQILDASGTVIGSTWQALDGTSLVKTSRPLADQAYSLRVRAIDIAGNLGPASLAISLIIDTTRPSAPSKPGLLIADDSGTAGDGLTNVRQPRLIGTAEPGSTVMLLDGSGNSMGSGPADFAGSYTIQVLSPLQDGTYLVSARAVDAAGNPGAIGPAFSLTILATPPLSPSVPSLLTADDSGGPGLTNVKQPRLVGSSAPDLVIQLFGASGILLGSTTSGLDGSYLVRLNNALADGNYAIHAVAIDRAGNISPPGPSFSLTILTALPATPSIPSLMPQDDSGTPGDRITNIRHPQLTATATVGITIRLINATNATIGSATATPAGLVTIAPSVALADGTYSLRLVAVDGAGNVSLPGIPIVLTILGTPPPQPNPPSLLPADDTGVVGDGLTSVRRPRIIGTAAPGGLVEWVGLNGSVLASAYASTTNGSYQVQPASGLPNGTIPVSIRETDVAGNVSSLSASYNLRVRSAVGDVFGDGQSDVGVYRATDGVFFIQQPINGTLFLLQFGGAGDVPINGDFFGNGHSDLAVYRPSSSTFFILDPVANLAEVVQLGQAGDVPVPADLDGDGRTDLALYRPSTSRFIIQSSATGTNSTRPFGGSGDIPVPADYFGNGHADLAIYRPSNATFYVYDPLAGGTKIATVGTPGGIPMPADYEGLGHVNPAVYQPGLSAYVILMSSTNLTTSRSFGGSGDIPIQGDFLGAGRSDLAIYRPSNATFYALDPVSNAAKVVSWGAPYQTWPTSPSITFWFSFGGGSKANAMAGKSSSKTRASTTVNPVEISLTTEIKMPMETDLSPKSVVKNAPGRLPKLHRALFQYPSWTFAPKAHQLKDPANMV